MVLFGAYPKLGWVCSTVRGLFRVRLGGGEEEGEFELELGGVVVVQMFGRRAQKCLLLLPSWLPF